MFGIILEVISYTFRIAVVIFVLFVLGVIKGKESEASAKQPVQNNLMDTFGSMFKGLTDQMAKQQNTSPSSIQPID